MIMVDTMTRIELIPTRTADGSVVLKAVVVGPLERLRARLAGYLELTELYEVGFSAGRTS